MQPDWVKLIRDIPDFPTPGVVYKDITPLLGDADAFASSVGAMCDAVTGWRPDKIVGIEARGFIFGAAVALRMGLGFVPVRKPGKLPFQTVSETYELEYGRDALESHVDAVGDSERAVVVDDVIATGGTAAATCRLVEQVGGHVAGVAALLELGFLSGRETLRGREVVSLATIEA